MVRLDAVTLAKKIGKRVDIKKLEIIDLPNAMITELGNFQNFVKLSRVLLKDNRIAWLRQIEGLFKCPCLQVLDLSGNPIQRLPNYRRDVLAAMPNLLSLDGVEIDAKVDTVVKVADRDTLNNDNNMAESIASSIFGDEELNQQMKIQEQIRKQQRLKEEAKERDRQAMIAAKNALQEQYGQEQPQKTKGRSKKNNNDSWLADPMSLSSTPPKKAAPIAIKPLTNVTTPPKKTKDEALDDFLFGADVPDGNIVEDAKPSSLTETNELGFGELEFGLQRARIASPTHGTSNNRPKTPQKKTNNNADKLDVDAFFSFAEKPKPSTFGKPKEIAGDDIFSF